MNNKYDDLTTEYGSVDDAAASEKAVPSQKNSKYKAFLGNKRNKLILIIATTAFLIAALCVGLFFLLNRDTISSYYDLFDEDMPYENTNVYDLEYVELAELKGYALSSYNEEFAVFSKNGDNRGASLKVLSFRTGEIVATFEREQTSNDIYNIDLVTNVPVFVFKRVEREYSTDINDESDAEYSLYDAKGNCVVTTDNSTMPYELADLLIYDYAAYTYDEDGVLTKQMDIPEFLMLDDCFAWNDSYLYVKDSTLEFTVYNREFDSISHWSAPSYVYNCAMYVLNSGDVLVQYQYILDEDSSDYDYIINNSDSKNLKIDLDTFIIDAKNGEETELKDFPYVVYGLFSKDEVAREFDIPDAIDYIEFENLVMLFPIVEYHIDDSASARDIRIMSNSGDLKESLKFVEFQRASIPNRISKDLFTVQLLSGQIAIIEADGTIRCKLDQNYEIVNEYIVVSRAIYDMDMNIIYNLHENHATVIGIIGDTIYVRAENDDEYNYISIRGDDVQVIYTIKDPDETNEIFDLKASAAYYMIYNSDTKLYTYYNGEDKEITQSSDRFVLYYVSNTYTTSLLQIGDSFGLFRSTADKK